MAAQNEIRRGYNEKAENLDADCSHYNPFHHNCDLPQNPSQHHPPIVDFGPK
jgi:hypothetical protein